MLKEVLGHEGGPEPVSSISDYVLITKTKGPWTLTSESPEFCSPIGCLVAAISISISAARLPFEARRLRVARRGLAEGFGLLQATLLLDLLTS